MGVAMINMHTKFEVSRLRRSKDILGGLRHWRDDAHFRDGLSPKGWHILGDLYVYGSSMARLILHGRLPISADWTFFASTHGWGTM